MNSTRAKLTVQVEFDAGSNWGDDCSMRQIREQASREGMNKIRNYLTHAGLKDFTCTLVTVDAVSVDLGK
jgi:hypothetical protein